MLCEACQRIFLAKRIPDPRWQMDPRADPSWINDEEENKPQYIHHASGQAFREAVEIGCQLCLLFWNQLSTAEQNDIGQHPHEIDPSLDAAAFVTRYCFKFWTEFGYNDSTVEVNFWELSGSYIFPSCCESVRTANYEVNFKLATEQAPLPIFERISPAIEKFYTPTFSAVSEAVGADDNALSLARYWIERCVRDHKHCSHRKMSTIQNLESHCINAAANLSLAGIRMGTSNIQQSNLEHGVSMSSLPTPHFKFARIIYVGQDDEHTEPQLCDTKDIPLDARYMTLSHCWGDGQPLKLTIATYESMKNCILLKSLPKTFADAIIFTKRLRVRYLWIDSLCIIQDSDTDWTQQSGVMGEIYLGSFCNIAATGARNSHGGLFTKRNPASISPLRVCIPNLSKVVSVTDGLTTFPTYYDCEDRSIWEREVQNSPLCRRGWVTQERTLSTRILHFGTRQLYWECCELSASETFVNSTLESDYEYGQVRFKHHDPIRPGIGATVSVLEFDVGYKKNPPPFLSAWAKLCKEYTAGGLSREEDKLVAISGLARIMASQTNIRYFAGLWECKMEHQLGWFLPHPGRRPSHYRAPSWSWASVDGPVVNFVEHAEGYPSRIRIIDAQVKSVDNGFTRIKSGFLRLRCNLIPGLLNESSKTTTRGAGSGEAMRFSIRGIENVTLRLDKEESVSEPVFCVLLVDKTNSKVNIHHDGLVLKATNTKGTFERIGRFNSSSKRGFGYFERDPYSMLVDGRWETLDPKGEVDGRFYQDYLDDDDDSKLIGNFVIEII